MIRRTLIAVILAAPLLAVSACGHIPSTKEDAAAKPLTVYLVRHAEKTKDRPDPDLTEEGQARAIWLADQFEAGDLDHIHSSDYVRTRDTAAPTADKLGLDIEIYDPRDLDAMAEMLLAGQGAHLVVGHSNTTPPLVEKLGGDPGTPIIEATEYNRFYVVTRTREGTITSERRDMPERFEGGGKND